MNERIQELAKNHLVHEHFSRYGERVEEKQYEFYPDELEKFAELIVRECLTVLEDERVQYDQDTQSFDEGQWLAGAETAIDNAAFAIKEHFGVEE